MFGKLKEKLSGGAKRMSGRTDLLEAVCASAALVAAADGDIDDIEIEATANAVTANKVLKDSFSTREIEACIDSMLARAQGRRVGKIGLWKEIEDVAGNHEDSEIVLLTAMDIADADGEVDPAEIKVLEKLADKLSLKLSDYDA
ncbi:tellurite resistance TerB family protein [Thalassobius sp. Cn5-15]|uniref:tellurite resistance TerB family protein n=1 Tax=Thalassobius sp. Cn5-15 TaxID=2917763 RepID=UPI001EF19F9E|nr:tellurite resistance TerB family protein [Thalassobius sp. Cn5-15]MCG7492405.1 tellurite resistance TerB family protein [Thalassobius sp. Cn5-15]